MYCMWTRPNNFEISTSFNIKYSRWKDEVSVIWDVYLNGINITGTHGQHIIQALAELECDLSHTHIEPPCTVDQFSYTTHISRY